MPNLIVNGGNVLSGEITPSGNKNSALPILCATLLTNEPVVLHNFPELTDVKQLVELMISLGSKIEWDKEKCDIKIDNSGFKDKEILDGGFPLGMRGAVLLLAPLVHRIKHLKLTKEIGGCSLGIRELDPHFDIIKEMGGDISKKDGVIDIRTNGNLHGADLWPDYMSVTATENFIMTAVLADGKSSMNNAASEPHVQDLCNFLNQMGADISGIGSSIVRVNGVNELHGTEFTISSDHHEITTLLALGAMTGGKIRVRNAMPDQFLLIQKSFKKLGVDIKYDGDTAYVEKKQKMEVLQPFTENMLQKVEAAPWPYFPADLLPLLVALAVECKGNIMFWNKLYEGGFFWIPEMIKFGAHIVMCDPHRIIVFGGKSLHSAKVNAPDIIRATVALMMVALTTKGESIINNADTINRAHPHFVENLQKLGADIRWSE
jgi:UDP-N-acetylglucosamine 1-carboxyvinyltransferase